MPTREQIRGLQKGEVIQYSSGYLIVSEVDESRGVVCGKLVDGFYGVNNLPIDQLMKEGRIITRTLKPGELEQATQQTQEARQPINRAAQDS